MPPAQPISAHPGPSEPPILPLSLVSTHPLAILHLSPPTQPSQPEYTLYQIQDFFFPLPGPEGPAVPLATPYTYTISELLHPTQVTCGAIQGVVLETRN